MSDIEITDINSQDKNRGEFFNFTKEITVNKNPDSSPEGNIAKITSLSQEFGSPFLSYAGTPVSTNDTITITLELDGTPVTYPHIVNSGGVYKIRLVGKYDGAFTDDVVKHVSAGSSDLIETPTTGNNIINLPDNVELFEATQGASTEVDVIYSVYFNIEYDSTMTDGLNYYFTHTVLNNSDIFPQLIGRATAQRVQIADNIGALAYQKTKLLGNINTATLNTIQDTEPFVTDPNAANFADLWNSALAGNVCKWQPVESTRGQFDFSGADILHAHCKRHGNKMLWHTLIWGADQGTPDWWEGLSVSESKAAFEAWCSAISTRYGDDIYGIQTLNEIATGHQDAGTTRIINQFGGAGTSGYDWAIYIFETARNYFPNAKLWINDFGMMSNQTVRDENCAVANAIKNHNPNLIDGIGMQSHYFNINDLTAAQITAAIDDVYAQTGLPIHITELDISGSEEEQLERYQRIFPTVYNHPNVERVTLWGYINTENWRYSQGHRTGLINRDGTLERPALTWLKDFMETGSTTTSTTLASQLLVKDNLVINIDAEHSGSYYDGAGTTITDLQGNSNATLSGTFNNTIPKNWEIDKDAGTSVEFITFGDIETFNAPQDFTFSIWFEFTSITADHDIFTKGSHATNKPILCWYDASVGSGTDSGNSQTISFMVTDDSNQHWIAAPSSSIVANQIYNLVVQHNTSGRARIFINNVEQRDHTQSTTDGMKNNTDPLKLGAPTGSSQDSDMKIYAFHAYNSFLTDAQITQNWNHLKGRFGL